MGIQRNWGWHREQRCSIEPQCEHINSHNKSELIVNCDKRNYSHRNSYKFLRQFGLFSAKRLYDIKSWRKLSIYSKLQWARHDKSNNHSQGNRNSKRYRHNKYLYSIAATFLGVVNPSIALAEGVGGVSATANPIANSSGSVTNQAIQVLQGPYITNTYGGGVQCQGSTLNVTPYLQFADARKDPWEDFYNQPQYNMSDFGGRTTQQTITVQNYPWEDWYDDRTKADGTRWFPDGEDMQITVDVDGPDGIPDNPGDVTWYKPVRTDMKANQSFNAGVSATLSIPLNKKLRAQCEQAAQAQINHQTQLTSNKRLDFEIARLKNCGELKKAGIFFHPKSPYHSICADVVVTSPGGKILPHTHQLPKPTWVDPSSSGVSSSSQNLSPTSLSSPDTGSSESQTELDGEGSSQEVIESSQSLSSPQASQLSGADQLGVWQIGHSLSQP